MYEYMCRIDVGAILIAYCNDCQQWVPPERVTYGMTENVNEPLNYKPNPSAPAHQETTS
jgi:hypothetical protein